MKSYKLKNLAVASGIFFFVFMAIFTIHTYESFAENNETINNSTSKLTEVDSKYVCMVNNKLFQDEQIPVEVEGKTYYGCCEMCKAKLAENPDSRYSTDPVSGVKVDKATAVVGATNTGKVYYFEDKTNLNKFSK